MTTINGYLDASGHPHFKLNVYGFSRKNKVSVDALFDSGFTGFLNLPLVDCMRAGLILFSTSSYTLANGKSETTLLCIGAIIIQTTDEIAGAISIDFNTAEPLLGMEFLRKINGKLLIDTKNKIVSIEYDLTSPIQAKSSVTVATSPSVSPSSSPSP